MTSFRMIDNEQELVKQALKEMEKFQPVGQHILNRTNIIQVREFYCYFSVLGTSFITKSTKSIHLHVLPLK